jgi:hypothetical protein
MSDGIEDTPSYTVLLPPARFSTNAKGAWDTTPETVRAEVLRMEKEFIAGFTKYKTAAERDASLTEFHLMAAKGGKNLKDVVASYVNMENLLRADTVKGLELICQNVGMSRTRATPPPKWLPNSRPKTLALRNWPTTSRSSSRRAPRISLKPTGWRNGSTPRPLLPHSTRP